MKPTGFLLLAFVLGACEPYWTCADGPTLCVDGVPVYMDPDLVESYATPEVGARISAQLAVSLAHWEVPAEWLAGWRLRYTEAETITCTGSANGCWDDFDRTITLTLPRGTGCIEAAPLPHEIGHFVDPGHTDARWCDFGAVLEAYRRIPACDAVLPRGWPLYSACTGPLPWRR